MRKISLTELTVGLVVGLFCSSAWGQSSNFAYDTPTLNRQPRNLGMGNVGISIYGSHDSSPFYNAAGLNDLEKGRFKFLSPTFEVSQGGLELISDLVDLKDNIDAADTEAGEIRAFDEFIANGAGDADQIRFTFNIFDYTRKNFSVGVLIDEKLSNSFRNPTFPNFELQNLGDLAGYLAAGYGFWGKLVQVGITFRPTWRFSLDEADQVVTYSDIVTKDADNDPILYDQLENITDGHFGLGVDLGFKTDLSFPGLKDWAVHKYLKTEIGFVWYDMGSPSFGLAPGNQQTIGTGIAIHPDIWKLKNTIALEFRDINLDRPLLSKFHFGVESKLPWMIGLRLGVNQGYFSGGLTLDIKYVMLEFAAYKEELGTSTRVGGDMRYIGSLTFKI